VTAAASFATMLLLAPVIALMPHAALAAVVIAYSVELIKPLEFRTIWNVRRVEFCWALIAFFGVILLGTLKGILIAVIASLVSLVYQAWNPPVYRLGRKRGTNVFRPATAEHPDDESWPGLLLLRTEGRVFFANAQRIGEQIMQLVDETRPRVVVLDCSAIFDLEYTALRMLAEGDAKLRQRGVTLWLAALNAEVMAVMSRSGMAADFGRERLLFNLETAVRQYEALAASPTRASSGSTPSDPTRNHRPLDHQGAIPS
jgi:MFS superfamily sulfate permease-like transporter